MQGRLQDAEARRGQGDSHVRAALRRDGKRRRVHGQAVRGPTLSRRRARLHHGRHAGAVPHTQHPRVGVPAAPKHHAAVCRRSSPLSLLSVKSQVFACSQPTTACSRGRARHSCTRASMPRAAAIRPCLSAYRLPAPASAPPRRCLGRRPRRRTPRSIRPRRKRPPAPAPARAAQAPRAPAAPAAQQPARAGLAPAPAPPAGAARPARARRARAARPWRTARRRPAPPGSRGGAFRSASASAVLAIALTAPTILMQGPLHALHSLPHSASSCEGGCPAVDACHEYLWAWCAASTCIARSSTDPAASAAPRRRLPQPAGEAKLGEARLQHARAVRWLRGRADRAPGVAGRHGTGVAQHELALVAEPARHEAECERRRVGLRARRCAWMRPALAPCVALLGREQCRSGRHVHAQ